MDQITASDSMNPYRLIALKAKQATKEREAKRKARLLERGSQNSGSGSSGVVSSGESFLGDGSFPRERSEWGRLQTSTTGSLSIPSSTPSTVELSNSRSSGDSHTIQSVSPSLTTPPNPPGRHGFEYDVQISDGPVPPPAPNGMNDMSHDTTTEEEEEDDDADLKRLMNQAQAMLTISDNPSQPETGSTNISIKANETVDETDLGREKVSSTSASADPNDERR